MEQKETQKLKHKLKKDIEDGEDAAAIAED